MRTIWCRYPALRKTNLEPLLARLKTLMPENPPLFAEDQITDRSERFFVFGNYPRKDHPAIGR